MEKKMENEMETAIFTGLCRLVGNKGISYLGIIFPCSLRRTSKVRV